MRLEAFDPNAIYEKLNSIPDVRDAIGKAGMSPREYATATAALMQAAMVRQMRAQGMQPPVQVNEANANKLASIEEFAISTRARVAGATLSGVRRARETVIGDTPARRATSSIRRRRPGNAIADLRPAASWRPTGMR